MAGSPQFKVYNSRGEYIAACKHVEDAAMIVAGHGEGATIRHQHGPILWSEGEEDMTAGESYDHVAQVCADRLELVAEVGSRAYEAERKRQAADLRLEREAAAEAD